MRKLLALSLLIVVADQTTKMAVKGFHLFGIQHEGMQLGQGIQVIGDFLKFTFVENPGMAFGIDLGFPFLLGLFSIGAATFLIHLMRQSKDGNSIGGFHISLALILGGAVGNLIDRVFYGVFYGYAPLFRGKVVDFVDVNIPDIDFAGFHLDRFYVFNIADSAVSVGIVLLLIFYPRFQRAQEERRNRIESESTTPLAEGDAEVGAVPSPVAAANDRDILKATGAGVPDERAEHPGPTAKSGPSTDTDPARSEKSGPSNDTDPDPSESSGNSTDAAPDS